MLSCARLSSSGCSRPRRTGYPSLQTFAHARHLRNPEYRILYPIYNFCSPNVPTCPISWFARPLFSRDRLTQDRGISVGSVLVHSSTRRSPASAACVLALSHHPFSAIKHDRVHVLAINADIRFRYAAFALFGLPLPRSSALSWQALSSLPAFCRSHVPPTARSHR
ncbi:hypothetical protein BV25DRAFT_165912 [Artomyces pyxidatus]|uniref:Uncharacterized protein n=1 Tax=Artomyces pyxidatus TaxID=48021 RepID=A0ACB8SIR3_9AGAM|nr:hypothetical protein BV25DRAFT_165912 [Artomyces pyxidatus]